MIMRVQAHPVPESRTETVPAYTLAKSKRNARKTNPGLHIPELAASILKLGLLQNLVVSRDGDLNRVEAGERRRKAIAWLIKKRQLAKDWPVPVRFVDEADRTAASVSENVQREGMHPADQYAAFQQLVTDGWSLDQVADAFGVTTLVVERRLAVAGAAPALLALYRKDEINTDQLLALCATNDHRRQMSAWTSAWSRDPMHLRRAVLSGEVEVTDPRVVFIGGPDAFVAAGGDIRRDLFSADGDGGFITDVGLLEQLVARKLNETAEAIRAEGWGWVTVWLQWDWPEFHRLGRIRKTTTALSPEAQARIEALQLEKSTLDDQADEFSEHPYEDLEEADRERFNAIWARLDQIGAELRVIHNAHEGFEPEAMAAAGAVVGLDNGAPRIERGMVRTADRERLLDATAGSSVVAGGRESMVPGRKAGGLSDPLTRSLYGYRNLAAQSATAANPHVAKVLLASWMVGTLRFRDLRVPLDLRISDMGSGTRTQHPIADEGGEAQRAALETIGTDLIAALPREDEPLWDALMEMSEEELDRLIGFAVASSVSLDREHRGLTAKLLTALGFDMADHFTPTAGNFFGRISKAQIIETLAEAGLVADDAERTTLAGLKKDALAKRAEAALATTRWVPPLIRTPAPEPIAEPAETKQGKAAKKRRPAGGTGEVTGDGAEHGTRGTGERAAGAVPPEDQSGEPAAAASGSRTAPASRRKATSDGAEQGTRRAGKRAAGAVPPEDQSGEPAAAASGSGTAPASRRKATGGGAEKGTRRAGKRAAGAVSLEDQAGEHAAALAA